MSTPTSRTLRVRTTTADATRRLGRLVAPLVVPGDVLALTGELGAGKTCFTQGLAAGLDVVQPVTSPTFMLQRTYPGRVRLVHLDVYRLDRLQDVMELGDEALAPDAVTVVEWGDTIASLLPVDRLDVVLRHEDEVDLEREPGAPVPDPTDDRPRFVELLASGSWDDRLNTLAEQVAGRDDVEVLAPASRQES